MARVEDNSRVRAPRPRPRKFSSPRPRQGRRSGPCPISPSCAGERENARTAIDEILRKDKKTWNDLTDLLTGESLDAWPDELGDAGQTGRMGPVRRTINLVCALGLTGTSAFSFIYFIFYAHSFFVWMLVTSAVLIFVGLYWLWADFINADPRPET
jgi:hypothetical protein